MIAPGLCGGREVGHDRGNSPAGRGRSTLANVQLALGDVLHLGAEDRRLDCLHRVLGRRHFEDGTFGEGVQALAAIQGQFEKCHVLRPGAVAAHHEKAVPGLGRADFRQGNPAVAVLAAQHQFVRVDEGRLAFGDPAPFHDEAAQDDQHDAGQRREQGEFIVCQALQGDAGHEQQEEKGDDPVELDIAEVRVGQ
jgi:hypothetical protein